MLLIQLLIKFKFKSFHLGKVYRYFCTCKNSLQFSYSVSR